MWRYHIETLSHGAKDNCVNSAQNCFKIRLESHRSETNTSDYVGKMERHKYISLCWQDGAIQIHLTMLARWSDTHTSDYVGKMERHIYIRPCWQDGATHIHQTMLTRWSDTHISDHVGKMERHTYIRLCWQDGATHIHQTILIRWSDTHISDNVGKMERIKWGQWITINFKSRLRREQLIAWEFGGHVEHQQ